MGVEPRTLKQIAIVNAERCIEACREAEASLRNARISAQNALADLQGPDPDVGAIGTSIPDGGRLMSAASYAARLDALLWALFDEQRTRTGKD